MKDKRAFDDVDARCVDTLRFLSVDMVQKADSGHPGLPVGACADGVGAVEPLPAPRPGRPATGPDRDRFVLSAGHGSALLYRCSSSLGYELSLVRFGRGVAGAGRMC